MSVRALVLEKDDAGVRAELRELPAEVFPDEDVTVSVRTSTLNYKDGLILAGKGGLVKTYPHVPGVDFAGVVEESRDARWKPGDEVLLTGWRVGEVHWGGYASRARVKGDWLVALPEGLDLRQAMAVGTAGFSAMLAVLALEAQGLVPGAGPVLVTGAAGGVGSIAVALLAAAGHEVAAVTGRPEQEAYLRGLGASRIVAREELAEAIPRPMESEVWAGAVDAVGGAMLSRVVKQLKRGASVAAVGNAGGLDVPLSVIPFLLRGVNILGIDSVMQPAEARVAAWARIARDLDMGMLEGMIVEAGLGDVPALGREILAGQVRGRVVIDVAA